MLSASFTLWFFLFLAFEFCDSLVSHFLSVEKKYWNSWGDVPFSTLQSKIYFSANFQFHVSVWICRSKEKFLDNLSSMRYFPQELKYNILTWNGTRRSTIAHQVLGHKCPWNSIPSRTCNEGIHRKVARIGEYFMSTISSQLQACQVHIRFLPDSQ